MRRALVMFTALSVVLVSASACIAASSPQASSASGQAVRTWNEIGRAQAAGNPLQHARVLAIMHAAQHDAVNGAVPRYETPASNLSDPDADAEAAAVTAAHAVLVSFFPGNQASAESSPVGWSRVGNIVSSHRSYDLHETARLQALLNMAMADGFIVGWFQKRHFAFWRPVTAIREADTDGNPSTTADAGWMALRMTPPLPDYPSTHSLLGGVAAEILRTFTGSDSFRFCMESTTAEPAGTQRCWETFTQVEPENAESRVMAGFHFRFTCDTGVDVGRKIGQFAIGHSLRPHAP